MILVIFTCCWFAFSRAEILEIKYPMYEPPTREEIFDAYFKNLEENESNRTRKSVSDQLFKSFDTMKANPMGNVTNLEKVVDVDDEEIFGPVRDYARAGVFKNFILAPTESTTDRYPTAVWSAQNYENLSYFGRTTADSADVRSRRRNDFAYEKKKKDKEQERRSKGKTKLKDYRITEASRRNENGRIDFADKFLEVSLRNYLISSNLKEAFGNVSVGTFSEILHNVTDRKPKKTQLPYDRNKELRMKFREEVILKRRNETKPQEKFLERQLQRRLEKVRDAFNERNRQKILANMWKYANLNRVTDPPEVGKNGTGKERTEMGVPEGVVEVVDATTEFHDDDLSRATTTTKWKPATEPSREHPRGTVKYKSPWYTSTESGDYHESYSDQDGRRDVLKLTAEESSYYGGRQFPTFVGRPERQRDTIPGTPYVDYPAYSFPPATKFKCPKFKDGQPKMIADRETRCQVFYICTGDGPETPMLCPNGTMFNDNFLVCDWWYNVHC